MSTSDPTSPYGFSSASSWGSVLNVIMADSFPVGGFPGRPTTSAAVATCRRGCPAYLPLPELRASELPGQLGKVLGRCSRHHFGHVFPEATRLSATRGRRRQDRASRSGALPPGRHGRKIGRAHV